MNAATLFDDCPVPKCHNPVDDGRPCGECTQVIANGYIREAPKPEPAPLTIEQARHELAVQQFTAEAARKADASARAAAAERGERPKPNQVCWCCEERRTCARDRDFPDEIRWICKDCEAIQ